jgi:hypothetical protein
MRGKDQKFSKKVKLAEGCKMSNNREEIRAKKEDK